MNRQTKLFAVIAFAFSTALAPAASHAQQVTMTVTGTIAGGYDRIGLFGPREHELAAGLPYTLSITVDAANLGDVRGDTWRRLYTDGLSTPATGYVTLAGTTYSWTMSLARYVQIDLATELNRLHVTADGKNDTDGWSVSANNQLGIDQPRGGWVKSLELDRDMAFQDYGSDGTTRSEFRVTNPWPSPPPDAPRDWSMSTWFRAEHQDSMVWTVSPVPEPGQYAMLLLGVVALGGLRRLAGRRG